MKNTAVIIGSVSGIAIGLLIGYLVFKNSFSGQSKDDLITKILQLKLLTSKSGDVIDRPSLEKMSKNELIKELSETFKKI